MIVHTIQAAEASGCFKKVVVSSDDEAILKVAVDHGASPYKRDSALADDQTPTAPVLLDVIEAEAVGGNAWDILSCLYATAPLRTASDIKNVVDLIDPGACDFAMAVCAYDRPVHQALTETPDGHLEPVWPEKVGLNSQDAGQFLFGNGSTYAVTISAFLETKSLYGPGLRGYEMPLSRSVDINTADDLALLNFYADAK